MFQLLPKQPTKKYFTDHSQVQTEQKLLTSPSTLPPCSGLRSAPPPTPTGPSQKMVFTSTPSSSSKASTMPLMFNRGQFLPSKRLIFKKSKKILLKQLRIFNFTHKKKKKKLFQIQIIFLSYLENEQRHGFLKIDFSQMFFGQKIALESTNFQKIEKNTSKIATNLQFCP